MKTHRGADPFANRLHNQRRHQPTDIHDQGNSCNEVLQKKRTYCAQFYIRLNLPYCIHVVLLLKVQIHCVNVKSHCAPMLHANLFYLNFISIKLYLNQEVYLESVMFLTFGSDKEFVRYIGMYVWDKFTISLVHIYKMATWRKKTNIYLYCY